MMDSLCFELEMDNHEENLTTELIWLGSSAAKNVVVLISATHGVEGFVGAAVQTDLLQRLQAGYCLPEDTAILLVFALNPYGFAYARRCDEQGIDLNRNFIDFNQPLPVNEGYESLKEIMAVDDANKRNKLLASCKKKLGQTAYDMAVSGGQYTDRQGPFYGGVGKAHGHKVIDEIIAHYQLEQRHLAVIDIHSGLGPYAHGELINDHPLASHGYKVANQWYGASVTAPAAGDSSSVKKAGLLDYRWHQCMSKRGCFVTLEFGSYQTQALFDAIIENHRCWKTGDQEAIYKSSLVMQEHFCPQDNYWRELVLVKSRQVIQQALDGLCYG